ncbi:MAG: hypothetical protein HKP27_08925 [Myxococcales bacterium]|nr:hypothetical protein [Myxococcales bacterium]
MRILSANIWNDAADPTALVERLKAWEVDIVALQELGPEQARALSRVYPHGSLEGSSDFRGMGIAANRPLEVKRVQLPFRDARVARVEAAAFGVRSDFELINVHLVAPHSWPPWRAYRLRREQVAGVLRWVGGNPGPQLLVGDLNSTPLWPAFRRLAAHFQDAAGSGGGSIERTWGPTPGAPRLLRIDHALTRRMNVAALRVVPIDGSDHSGLLIDV